MAVYYPNQPTPQEIDQFLAEDVGSGDLTAAIIPAASMAVASVVTREAMVLCGQAWFDQVFQRMDASVSVSWLAEEGADIVPNTPLCRLIGPARTLLTGERTALNLLQTLSATATLARRYAAAIAGTGVRVLDTRKTLPGLRKAQKYAVRCGGCHNHRMGLYDGILIKENHIMAAGSITRAIEAAVALKAGVIIEVEVENLEELKESLEAGARRILLDEFSPEMIREAVALARGRAELEVSGNVDLNTIREVALTGVDYISVGALTKNLQAIDLSMRVELEPA